MRNKFHIKDLIILAMISGPFVMYGDDWLAWIDSEPFSISRSGNLAILHKKFSRDPLEISRKARGGGYCAAQAL